MLSRLVVVALILSLGGFVLPLPAGAGEPVDVKATEELSHRQSYCPPAALIFDGIVILGGRCYTLLLLRDARGIFLAFADPGTKIPPGQLVRLRTPAGAKLKGRIFYLVPLRAPVGLIGLDTVVAVGVRVQGGGSQVTIVLTGVGANVSVTFKVRR